MANKMRNWIETHSGRVLKNFINGEWVESRSGQTFPLYESAFPERVLGYVPSSNNDDVEYAIQSAHDAYQQWKKTTASERAKILNNFAELLERNEEELAYILSSEQGKVLNESRGEVKRAAAEARFNAGEAYRVNGMTVPSEIPGITCQIIPQPIGVIAAISPWNFPIVTPVRKIAPAIAYGCTVVLKPSSDTPWSAVRLVELLHEAGLPKGVVNLINGSGSKVGDSLVSHPLIKGISFTGSTKLGIQINREAAARLIKTQLEMGGKNAAVVANYHDLEAAAKQIVSAAFTCSGQRCTAISRVIVLEEQANELVDYLKVNMEAIRIGPSWEENANMGPVINQNQYENILEYIELGKSEGAEIVLGGTAVQIEGNKGGHYISPTLFNNVHKDMRIAREEIFGPVLVVISAKSIEEAIEIANSTEYGLAASVFTDSLSISNQFSEQIETGMVHINHGTASQSHIPFGGVKNSGFGAFSIGPSNQNFYTSSKAIYVKAD